MTINIESILGCSLIDAFFLIWIQVKRRTPSYYSKSQWVYLENFSHLAQVSLKQLRQVKRDRERENEFSIYAIMLLPVFLYFSSLITSTSVQ